MNERIAPPTPEIAGLPGPEVVRFEYLLAELSARFINLPAARVDDAITDALRRIVELLDVDRCQLIRFPDNVETTVTHSWAVQGVPPVPRKSLTADFPWTIRRLRAGHTVMFGWPDNLPPEAAVDKATWQQLGTKSNLTMPMIVAGKVEGVIALGCLRHERSWPDELIKRVRVLATVFGNALAHKRTREELDAALSFERITSETLAALLTTPRADQSRIIEAGLRDMARTIGAERATLWRRIGDRREFAKTHRWLDDPSTVAEISTGAVEIPWISAQLASGAVVRFARHADLPTEAAEDLPRLRVLNVVAAVMVPLKVSGAVVGALSFGTAREDREWPDALVPRVTLLGEVFASVLTRQEAERREEEAQAQAAHAARVGTMGVFAASLVHEITQPIAASLANAETAAQLLTAPVPNLDELRAAIADIVSDDRRAGDLIQQLRRFLRRGEAQRTDIDVCEIVDEVLRLVANEATGNATEIKVDLPDTLPRIVGDRVQLSQVLLNLLLNGLDAVATSQPGARRVAVRASVSGSRLSIEVSDTGHGMDEATLASIFQPFFTTKPGGMGLGLSISRTIVAAHGGTLSAQSTPGNGTSFRVELPVRQELADASPKPSGVIPRSISGTVFVIDDDPSMRRAIERQLQREDFRIETFASAQEFLDRPTETGVACIVSDVRMPGLSGLDLQASLAQADRALPIVFISGHGDIQTTVHAMKAGAVSFLSKPFTRRDLLAAVAEALARSRSLVIDRKHEVELKARYESLTPREREVFALVAEGLLNKIIADRLGAAESTVKIHRGRVMEKMGAAAAADLVRMAERLALRAPEPAQS